MATDQLEAETRDNYRWVALTNTTAAVFMSALDGSIVIISLPAIFRGIHLDPLAPANITYLLWMIMGYRLVQSVLVVTLGRIGDMYGRVRVYNFGFTVFTVASILLSFDPFSRCGGRSVAHRLAPAAGRRGIDAHGEFGRDPHRRVPARPAWLRARLQPGRCAGRAVHRPGGRGTAGRMGLAGGVLGERARRCVRHHLGVPAPARQRRTAPRPHRLVGQHHVRCRACPRSSSRSPAASNHAAATRPAGRAPSSWQRWWLGIVLLIAFVVIESRVAEPMIRLSLFKIRAFSAGNSATLAAALAQGGLQFMLIIWLQGIWLPLHGYDYADTPLWAGIFMLPLTAGFLVAGPAAGAMSDRFGARGIASVGMLLFGLSFVGLLMLPINFPYWAFALLIALNGIGSGMFAAPNTSAIMGSVLPSERGVVSGMRATFQNSGTALSIGVFFSLMVIGLAHSLPTALTSGLQDQGVPHAVAAQVARKRPPGRASTARAPRSSRTHTAGTYRPRHSRNR